VYQFRHTSLSSHSLKHIPESDTTFSSNILLITNQVLYSRHSTEVTGFGFIVPVADTQQLIILEYGLNVATERGRNYDNYQKGLLTAINHLKEVIENDSLLSVHCQSIEKSRICTVHRPAYGTDTPVHLIFCRWPEAPKE